MAERFQPHTKTKRQPATTPRHGVVTGPPLVFSSTVYQPWSGRNLPDRLIMESTQHRMRPATELPDVGSKRVSCKQEAAFDEVHAALEAAILMLDGDDAVVACAVQSGEETRPVDLAKPG